MACHSQMKCLQHFYTFVQIFLFFSRKKSGKVFLANTFFSSSLCTYPLFCFTFSFALEKRKGTEEWENVKGKRKSIFPKENAALLLQRWELSQHQDKVHLLYCPAKSSFQITQNSVSWPILPSCLNQLMNF